MAIFNALLNLSELKELYSGKPICVCPLYNGVINTSKTYEATGNPIVLPEYKSLVKLKTTFSPIQTGDGDPSPENVRPISGWDEVTVTRCGKNLIGVSKIDQSTPGETSGTSISVNFPVSITISANYSAATISKTIWRFKIGFLDGSLQYAVDDELNGTSGTHKTFNGTQENPITSITYRGTNITSGEISNVMCNISSTPEPYAPYQGNDYTLTLPETMYGGTVDAVTGEGMEEWGYIASYNEEDLPGEWISDRDVYEPGTTPTTGAQVAYKLATPEPFKISQVSIPSLRGENTFFTNGENMDIIYKETSFWSDGA